MAIPILTGEPAAVTNAEALADQQWFDQYPGRRYHIRPGWVVRARGRGVFLRARVTLRPHYPDTERAAEAAWWAAAYPTLSPETRRKMAKAARRRLGRRRPTP